MPEGFSSVADLKVIVDANTEKFHSGLSGVIQAVDGLGARADSSFGGLSRVLDIVGGAALGVRGKFQLLVAGAEAGIAVYQQFAAQGRSAAEAIGVTKEYDQLKSSIDGLGLSLKDGAVATFFAVEGAATAAAGGMFGFSSATGQAANKSDDFAARLLSGLAKAFDEVTLRIRLASSELANNAGDINQTLTLLDQRAAVLRERIGSMQRGESPSRQGATYSNGLKETDLLAVATAELNANLAEKNRLLGLRAVLPGQDWVDATKVHQSLLGAEILSLEQRNATLGMSAGAAAEYNAVQKAMNDASRQGIVLGDDELRLIRQEASEIGRLTQVKDDRAKADADRKRLEQQGDQRERQTGSILGGAEREILNITQRERALSMTARAAAELGMQERLLQQLRASGIPLDEAAIVKITALSAAYGEATERASESADEMRQMGEVGQAVAGGLQGAFARWANGAKLDVKDMAASILADLAQMALRASVLQPLFGGGGTAGGGLLGSLLASVFGGARADGGPVDSGKAYLVGERGPEIFMPGASGAIIPNGAGGSNVSIITNVDARGATPDAVAQIRLALAERDAQLPSHVLGIMRNATDRSLA